MPVAEIVKTLLMGQAAAIIIAPGVVLLGTILPSIWNTTRDVEGTVWHRPGGC